MSGEHRVSKALFDGPMVAVHGFSWCKDAPVRIGINSATANILCKTHNSDLGPLDTAASHAFKSLAEMFRTSLVRSKDRSRRWSIKRYSVSGPKLERWFLKTLINLSLVREYDTLRIGRDSNEAGTPSDRLVRIAFGKQGFDGCAGLYAARLVGEFINAEGAVRFAPLVAMQSRVIVAGVFLFGGIAFGIFLEPDELPMLPPKNPFPNGGDWNNCKLIYHMPMITETSGGRHISQLFEFDWYPWQPLLRGEPENPTKS